MTESVKWSWYKWKLKLKLQNDEKSYLLGSLRQGNRNIQQGI